MYRILFLTIALTGLAALGSMSSAQDKQALAELVKLSPEEFIKHFDRNKDGFLQVDEMPSPLRESFAKVDVNGDGKADPKEVVEMLKVLRQRLAKDKPPPPNPEVERFLANILERMDRDKDGKLSKEEAQGPIAQNFAALDTNKDGFLDRSELRVFAARVAPFQGGNPGGPPGPDFDALDRNADGRLTREELKGTPFAGPFDEIDTNRDGKIDRKEFTAHLRKQAEKKEP